jgi:hypothetical protein
MTVATMAKTGWAQERLTDEQMARKVVGKWQTRTQVASPLGIMNTVTEAVYQPNGRFSALSTSGSYQFFSEGRWEIRNGNLIQRYTNWSPRRLRNLDGSWSPIHMPEYESSPIQFLNENRVRTNSGEAIRL